MASCRTAAKMMDEVVEIVANLKNEWNQTSSQIQENTKSIANCGKSGKGTEEANLLPSLNAFAQDGMRKLKDLLFQLDLHAPQLPTEDEVESAQAMLKSWKEQHESLYAALRNAQEQAASNILEAAKEERALLLGGGEESTILRRNLQTKAGMVSSAETSTETLRRTHQLMVQELERSANTLATFEESTSVLRKAESEYKGHRSLLSRTRQLLTTMSRQDVMDRLIMVVGFFIFVCVVLYVVSKRVGLLTLQRKVIAAMKSGSSAHLKDLQVNVEL